MRALKFYQTGSLDNLRMEEVPMPIPAAGELLLQVKAAASGIFPPSRVETFSLEEGPGFIGISPGLKSKANRS
jgi:hypothetical protein